MSSSEASTAPLGGLTVSDDEPSSALPRRRIAFVALALLLLAYYAGVFLLHAGEAAQTVDLDVEGAAAPADRVELDVQVVELAPSERSMSVLVQPVPRGDLASVHRGELETPVVLEVASPGRPPLNFDFAADQVIDAVTVPLALDSGAYGYPFDRPGARARFTMVTKGGQNRLPLSVSVTNSANDWRLSGSSMSSDNTDLSLELQGKRDLLISSLAVFYLFAIATTAIITVSVIGRSLTDGEVTFSEVIWLGAMLVAIPAIRNEMPDAPAMGTAVDVFVFFPAVGIVALTLLVATVVLALSQRDAEKHSLGEDD